MRSWSFTLLEGIPRALLACLVTAICHGQPPVFRHYDDDLSQQVGRALLQDRHGFIWIGTQAGLNRFDGDRFQSFGITDGLVNDWINAIAETEDGRLWIATPGGLSTWDGTRFATIPHTEPETELMVLSLSISSEGALVCGTSQGLYRVVDDHLIADAPAGLPHEPIWSLCHGSDGVLWAGGETGLYAVRDGQAFATERLSGQKILGSRQQGRDVWAVSDRGLFRVRDHEVVGFYATESLGNPPEGGLMVDQLDVLWIGTQNGVVQLADDTITKWQSPEDMPLGLIYAILEDRDGMLWFAGAPGLAALEPQVFTNFTDSDGLGSPVVRDLLIDQRGRLWAATFAGLSYREGNRWITLGAERGLGNELLITMTTLGDHELMVGSRGGMWILDLDTLQFRAVSDIPSDQSIYCVVAAEDGQWFSVLEGGLFFRALDGTVREIEVPGQTFRQCRLLIDSQNRLWASGDQGLSRLDRGGWTTLTTADGLAHERPYTLFEDSRNRIWLSYHASVGCSVIDNGRVQTLTEADGLLSNTVFMVNEDASGNIWIGGTAGIDRYDGKCFTSFDKRDGLVGIEANSGAFAIDSEGRIWIGTMTGLVSYEGGDTASHDLVPHPYLTQATLEGDPIEGSLRVAYERNDLIADVAFLNYYRRNHLQARYRLRGFEDDWKPWTSGSIYRTNLEPGDYVLEVAARFDNNPWETTDLTSFTIEEPWWLSWPVSVSLGLLFLMIVFGFARWRVAAVERQKQALAKVVDERTVELRAEIAQRKQAQEDLLEARDELISQAHQAGRADVATGVLHNIGNLLSSVTTSAGVVREGLEKTRLIRMADATALLEAHQDDLVGFLCDDPKGTKVIPYLINLERKLSQEHRAVVTDMERLVGKLDLIRNYIMLHQTYARAEHFVEEVSMTDVIEDALVLQSGSIDRHGIQLEKHLEPLAPVRVQKAKLITILINLYKNAKEAMADTAPHQRRLRIDLFAEGEHVILKITDNGCGIPPEQTGKLFSQGYTTKTDGNGFGLHSCANYMRDMGGSIRVESEGIDRGASFTLRFPRTPLIDASLTPSS